MSVCVCVSVCLSECDQETSQRRRRPTRVVETREKKKTNGA